MELKQIGEALCQLFAITEPKGYPKEVVEAAKQKLGGMPDLLEQFYCTYGLSEELQHLQDNFMLPDRYTMFLDSDYLIFFNENQGVCQAGINKKDLALTDPPVYVGYDDKNWKKSCETLSQFLLAMFGYQASICLAYAPEEFYWISEKESIEIAALFPKRPESLLNWMCEEITLYDDNHQARIALMDVGGDAFQMNYAANNYTEFMRIQNLLKGMGEPI